MININIKNFLNFIAENCFQNVSNGQKGDIGTKYETTVKVANVVNVGNYATLDKTIKVRSNEAPADG